MRPYKCFLRSNLFWSVCEIRCVTMYSSRVILILIVCATAGLRIMSFWTIIVSLKLILLLTHSALGLALS